MATRSYATVAWQYARDVVVKKILTCKWVRLASQKQLDDLERFKGKGSPYRFNPKLMDKSGKSFAPGDNVCAFIERLPHVKGPLAGEPIHLEPWQVFILTAVRANRAGLRQGIAGTRGARPAHEPVGLVLSRAVC